MVNCPFVLRKSNKGISITELLIVVAILTMLMVVFLAAFKPWTQQAKARDARRKSDLQKLKNPLEDYYNDYDCYPDVLDDLVPDYLGEVPRDPETNEPYTILNEDCDKYYIYVKLEYMSDPEIAEVGCTNGCGPISETGQDCSYNYGVCSSNSRLEVCTGEDGEVGEGGCSGTLWSCQGGTCNVHTVGVSCRGSADVYCDDSSCKDKCGTCDECCVDCDELCP